MRIPSRSPRSGAAPMASVTGSIISSLEAENRTALQRPYGLSRHPEWAIAVVEDEGEETQTHRVRVWLE